MGSRILRVELSQRDIIFVEILATWGSKPHRSEIFLKYTAIKTFRCDRILFTGRQLISIQKNNF
jgi:hypothetical protein